MSERADQLRILSEEVADELDRLTEELRVANISRTEHAARAADLTRQLEGSTAQVAILLARIAELEGDPGPVPVETVFGSSRPDLSLPGVRIPFVRSYLQPGERPTAISQDAGLRRAFDSVQADGLVWFSIKEEAGPWLRTLVADMQNRHRVRLIVTADHEPFDGWWETGRQAQWHTRQAKLEATLGGVPGVTLCTVLEGWRVRTEGYYEAMYRPAQMLGFDSYNVGAASGGAKAYIDPAQVHERILAYAAERGRDASEIFIGETGTNPVTSGDRAGQNKWAADNRAFLNGRVAVAAWFNTGTCQVTAAGLTGWLG